MRINWSKAVLAGLVGTLAFDLVGWVFTQQWWDIPALLGAKLGAGTAVGVLLHYANGALLGVIYAGLAPSLWGPSWARALLFVTAETVFGVWFFMLPLLGAGPMGLTMGAAMPIVSLVRHWVYGLALAALYPITDATPGRMAA